MPGPGGSDNLAGEMLMRDAMERERQKQLKLKYEAQRRALIGSRTEEGWAQYVREGGTSPWGKSGIDTDEKGYAMMGQDDTLNSLNATDSANQNISKQTAQLNSAQSTDGSYPAMQNSYGLGQGGAPMSSSTPSAGGNPWGTGYSSATSNPVDSGSRGFTPYSLKGEANYR